MANVLVCDDEKDIVSALKIYLSAEGYEVFTAANGREALDVVKNNEIHLALIDIMMPEMDGVTAVSKIRENYNLPIIFLTAKSEDADKVLGLNIGADDYITKPFNPVEVIARVRSHLRRYMTLGCNHAAGADVCYTVGGIVLDDATKKVTLDGDEVSLTPTEYEILKLLMSRPGNVLSTKQIYKNVWNEAPYGAENTVAVHIRHLREKLEINSAEPRYLKVVWGQGYKIEGGKSR
ncbi:MAG: response regulator transcription factor [Eubacteriales bacterium]